MRRSPTPKPPYRTLAALTLLQRHARTASERRAIAFAIQLIQQRTQRGRNDHGNADHP